MPFARLATRVRAVAMATTGNNINKQSCFSFCHPLISSCFQIMEQKKIGEDNIDMHKWNIESRGEAESNWSAFRVGNKRRTRCALSPDCIINNFSVFPPLGLFIMFFFSGRFLLSPTLIIIIYIFIDVVGVPIVERSGWRMVILPPNETITNHRTGLK